MTGMEAQLELFIEELEWIWHATVFPKIVQSIGKLEIGRRLLKFLGSQPDFLRIGLAAEPEVREEWRMMTDDREGWQTLLRCVRRGPSWRVHYFLMSSVMAAAEGKWKSESGQEKGIWRTGGKELLEVWEASWSWLFSCKSWGRVGKWVGCFFLRGGMEWDQKSVETIVVRGIQFTCSRLGGDGGVWHDGSDESWEINVFDSTTWYLTV